MSRHTREFLLRSVDFAGSGVLVPDPGLRLHQCGLPRNLELMLFEPLVLRRLVESGRASSPLAARKRIARPGPAVWEALEKVSREFPVLVQGGEGVDRSRFLSFRPVPVDGDAIRIHPLIARLWEVKFDGTEASVHAVFSVGARLEATLSRPAFELCSSANGLPRELLSDDLVLGCYALTRAGHVPGPEDGGPVFGTRRDLEYALSQGKLDWWTPVRFRNPYLGIETVYGDPAERWIETTAGRVRFNAVLPGELGFVNFPVRRKDAENILRHCARRFGRQVLEEVLESLASLVADEASRLFPSTGLFDLITPQGKEEAIREAFRMTEKAGQFYERGIICRSEKLNKILDIWTNTTSETRAALRRELGEAPDSVLAQLANAGVSDIVPAMDRVCAMVGPVASRGSWFHRLPVVSSYREGLRGHEFLMVAGSSRRGEVNIREQSTRAGALAVGLIRAARGIVISEDDCGTLDHLSSEASRKGWNGDLPRLFGRVGVERIVDSETGAVLAEAGEAISLEAAGRLENLKARGVKVRSPITCAASRGCCQRCCGLRFDTGRFPAIGEDIGLLAAQTLGTAAMALPGARVWRPAGEPRVFEPPLPRLEALFEVREPRVRADLARFGGTVRIGRFVNRRRQIIVSHEEQGWVEEVRVSPNKQLLVRDGDVVEAGARLTMGDLDLRDVLEVHGLVGLHAHFVEEVQEVFRHRGMEIGDRHIEVILSRMLQRVEIVDPGDSVFGMGDIVTRDDWLEANERIGNGHPVIHRPLVTGISRFSGETPG